MNVNTQYVKEDQASSYSPESFISPSLSPSVTVSNESNKEKHPRKRTRASSDQLSILEKSFSSNPSPNSRVREHLSRQLGMSERSIQIWFQNRRAKVKNMAKKTSILHEETLRLQYYASSAAAAACQAAAFSQQRLTPNAPMDDPIKTNPDLYYYYYYYYYNEQQQKQKYALLPTTTPVPPPPPIPFKSMPPPPLLPSAVVRTDNEIPDQYNYKRFHPYGGRVRAHTIGPSESNPEMDTYQRSRILYDRGASVELSNLNRTGVSPNITTNIYNYIPNHTTMTTIPLNFPHDKTPTPTPTTHIHATPTETHTNNAVTLSTKLDESNNAFSSLAMTETPMYNNQYLDQTGFSGWTEMVNTNTTLFQQVYLSIDALQIGSWKRMGFHMGDLSCSFDKERRVFIWCIQDGAQRFKMEFHEESVESIRMTPQGNKVRMEMQVVQVSFYMELNTPDNWIQCRDYTEDKQASSVSLHELEGSLSLKTEMEMLVQESELLQSRYIK